MGEFLLKISFVAWLSFWVSKTQAFKGFAEFNMANKAVIDQALSFGIPPKSSIASAPSGAPVRAPAQKAAQEPVEDPVPELPPLKKGVNYLNRN